MDRNALVNFIKQSQNKPIIEKLKNLIGVLDKNQLIIRKLILIIIQKMNYCPYLGKYSKRRKKSLTKRQSNFAQRLIRRLLILHQKLI